MASMQGIPKRLARWSVLGTIVFTYMHVADELWSRWDFGGETVTSSQEAALLSVIPLIVGLWAYSWIERDHAWASLVATVFGAIQFTTSGLWHLLDTAGMDAFRYVIVALASLSALTLVAVCGRDLFTHPPWSRSRPAA